MISKMKVDVLKKENKWHKFHLQTSKSIKQQFLGSKTENFNFLAQKHLTQLQVSLEVTAVMYGYFKFVQPAQEQQKTHQNSRQFSKLHVSHSVATKRKTSTIPNCDVA